MSKPSVPGWVAALPDELKGNETVLKFAKPGDFVKDALSWKERSERGIYRPTDKSTADELAAYRKAMGIPETLDGYEIPDEIDGIKLDAERIKEFRETAHKLGIPADAVKALAEMDARQAAAATAKAIEANGKAVALAEATFQSEWGADFSRNKEIAERGLNSLPAGVKQKVLDLGLASDPDMVRYLFEVGSRAIEADIKGGRPSGVTQRTAAERLYG
jgi:hypothetical protein